jgi:peroxiredoxin
MSHPSVAALEAAFQDVRDRDLPLGERLRLISDCYQATAPVYAATAQRLIERLQAVRAGSGAPQVGEQMPDFLLPDHDGRFTSLSSLLAAGPVVLAFHRGHWCPYCRLNMVGLAEIQAQVAPARIVAISAEVQQHTRSLRAEARALFPFLSDIGAGYALSLNLATWIDERMSRMIASSGWDIPTYQGGGGWVLPTPAVFVVRRDGTIAARHVDPDYRRRMELDELLAAVAAVRAE